jgi:branched-chain amino acid transport system ATP-binding protein
MAFFKIENVTRSFGGLLAVDNLSFQVEKGSIFSIIGPNGAGKTTVFNCISGMYHPDRGNIIFEGQPVAGLKPHEIARRGITRTFQNRELFPMMTALENILLGRHILMRGGVLSGAAMVGRNSPAAREEIAHRESVEKIIDLLDLQSARDRLAGQLPYGKQKLVELARALALQPKLLLLDEPFAGMNREERQDLYFWLQDIREELGVTILMIEHDLSMVTGLSDRVLVIDFGKSITEGKPGDVVNHPGVIKAYLGGEE